MLLALDFRDFPSAEIAVSFENSQKIACLDRNMLPDITDKNHPHVVFLRQPQQFFALPIRLQARFVANDNCAAQIKL
jgi:hypothetical protein